jgi:hypothetical protein
MAPASAGSVRAFAAAEGATLDDRRPFAIGRRHRLLIRLSKILHLPWLGRPAAARRRSLIHFEPEFGSLLFRWAVGVIKPRYAVSDTDEAVLSSHAAPADGVTASVGNGP